MTYLRMRRVMLEGYTAVVALIVLPGWLAVNASTAQAQLTQKLLSGGIYLADFWNQNYRVCFPLEAEHNVQYKNQDGDYIESGVAGNGRSVFAVRSFFDGRTPSWDILIRRSLKGDGGPEQVVSSSFQGIQDFAVSPNEAFAVVAGRLSRAASGINNEDGIFLLDIGSGSVTYVAPYLVGTTPGDVLGTAIRSLNVNARGDLILYEDDGVVVRLSGAKGQLTAAERHAGQFPVLMPNGEAYIYFQGGRLLWSDGKVKRELLHVPQVLGGIRVSPDGQFIAFGQPITGAPVSEFRSRLKICELASRKCVDGPEYFELTAGRQTFWIRP